MGDGVSNGYVVTETIEEAHQQHPTYPLLSGDLLVKEVDGTYTKICPGLGVSGFILRPEIEATLRPVQYVSSGLDYVIL